MTSNELEERLAVFLQRQYAGAAVRVDNLRLLTGGASRQTWSFDAIIRESDGETSIPLILRSDPRATPGIVTGKTEFALLQAAHEAGVPVPKVLFMGDQTFDVPCMVMERVEGETIPRRLLRDGKYATARKAMTPQLGEILARIHRISLDSPGLKALPDLAGGASPAAYQIDKFEQLYRAITPDPHPTFELAFRWLRERARTMSKIVPALVHGDFRIGNVIFGPDGARAILDWEAAHVGDPMEDLGWIAIRSWRFGNDDAPVGGIGSREEFWRAYEDAGGVVDAERVHFWEAFSNLRWGIICIIQAKTYLDGRSKSVELAAIGRRVAETEWELLQFMEEW